MPRPLSPTPPRNVTSIRLLPRESELIRNAATLEDRNLSNFIRKAAIERAREVLALAQKCNTKTTA